MTNADVPLVELRRYALHPGTRDEMLGIFERELMEGQEAAGMRLLGQFRDLDDPDAFVWLRGFRDMASRYTALWDFYTGPVWKNHQEAVNATMISSDDVLLLRPYGPDGHLPAMTAARIHANQVPMPRLVRGYLSLLCFVLAGYLLLGRAFAYLGFPPLYIGEITLALGIVAALMAGNLTSAIFNWPGVALALLMLWTAFRTIPYLPTYGFDAPRDAVTVF